MKEQEIIEGNILIAEFLGSKFINDAPKDYPNGYYYQPEGMEDDCPIGIPEDWLFNIDWNWLMPVVEKIESLQLPHLKYTHSIEVIISRNECIIEYSGYEMGTICEITANTKIRAVYNACIKFIKQLNKK